MREDVAAILLDEPLTVIDPQLKFELRRILKEINEEFHLTTVLVTHDQTEAMTFARQVIVMNQGEVVQAGEPHELFNRPATDYVGYFIGSPAMNFLPAHVEDGQVKVAGTGLSVAAPSRLAEGELSLGFRPEHARIVPSGGQVTGKIERVWFEGMDEVIALSVKNLQMRVRAVGSAILAPGDTLTIAVPEENLLVYSSGRLVTP